MLAGGAWIKRGATRRWLIVGAGGAVVVAAGASVAVALGGGRAPAPSHHAATTTAVAQRAVPRPEQCVAWDCTRAQHVDLGGGYTLSLWHAGKPGDERAEPVLELARRGVSVQWWLAPRGNGWAGTLSCNVHAPEPNCVLSDGDGVHSAVAQMLVLRDGRLVAPPDGHVVADLPTLAVRDLDGDGYLDVAAVDSDYLPNFAQGHQFWHTFRYAGGQYLSTGCTPHTAGPPAALLAGACPTR